MIIFYLYVAFILYTSELQLGIRQPIIKILKIKWEIKGKEKWNNEAKNIRLKKIMKVHEFFFS